jgi:putative ABC transport system permease protein
MRALLSGFRNLFHGRRREHDLDDELRAFYEASVAAKIAAGMPRAEAERVARIELGSPAAVKDWVRDVTWAAQIEGLWQDLRYAARSLARNPAFAGFVVVTLALGIGASTAIFSVAYGVALRPLPYPEPERLVRIHEARPADGRLEHEVSIGTFHAWREGAPSIASAALFSKPGTRFLVGADAIPLAVMSVSPSFFDVLGVPPLLGTGFRPEREYTRFTGETEAVLSFGAWQRLFGGHADVAGQSLTFAGLGGDHAVRIVGVMPAGFAFAEPADLWVPSITVEDATARLMRQWRYNRAVARIQPGVPIARVRAEVIAISSRLGEDYPDTNGGWTASVEPLHAAVIGSFAASTWLLLATVGVVLLVACVNVGGLFLSRAVAREQETAVRVALGAGSARLIRLWLIEATLLSLAGAAVGLLLAWAGVGALIAAAPPGIPRLDSIAIDRPVLAVASAATLLALFGCALAPLGALRRRALTTGSKGGPTGAGAPPRQTLRVALIVAQCAGAAALVILAAMLTRSLQNLTTVDLGWTPDGVLSLRASPPMPPELRRPWARFVDWSDQLIARLESLPDITRAAITTQIPLSTETSPATLARGRGRAEGGTERWTIVKHNVSDGYFDAMGIRLLSGRTFDARDRFTPEQLVDWGARSRPGSAIVTARTALALWPGEAAEGQRLWLPDIDNVEWRDVVGVVEDIDFAAIGETEGFHVFVPWTQMPTGNPRLIVKGTGSGAALAPDVRAVVQEVAPGTRVDQVVALEDLAARATAQPRFTSRVVALFGLLALALAAVGVHGTLAYLVGARTREMGIRLALGAPPGALLRRTLMSACVPALIGGIAGIGVAVLVARVSSAMLFEVSVLDLPSILAGSAVLLCVALGAALGPARRAARVDPVVALRAE